MIDILQNILDTMIMGRVVGYQDIMKTGIIDITDMGITGEAIQDLIIGVIEEVIIMIKENIYNSIKI